LRVAYKDKSETLDAQVKDYQSWLCREEHFNQKKHAADMPQLEKEWPEFRDSTHDALCRRPRYMTHDVAAPIGTPASENRFLRGTPERRQVTGAMLRLAGVDKKVHQQTPILDLITGFAED
jgi:hypothetical protein